MTKGEREQLATVADTAARLSRQMNNEREVAKDHAQRVRLQRAERELSDVANVLSGLAGNE